jgi:hypothetical protein
MRALPGKGPGNRETDPTLFSCSSDQSNPVIQFAHGLPLISMIKIFDSYTIILIPSQGSNLPADLLPRIMLKTFSSD